jgi:hypothetical protein
MIGWMNETVTDNKERVSELSNLVEEYPYFQTAHVLFTQYLKAVKDSRFQTELRKTACYAGDRTKLFYLIENKSFSADKLNELEKVEAASHSPFDWIDSFLKEKKDTPAVSKQSTDEKTTLPSEALIETPTATDYIGFISKTSTKTEKETEPAPTVVLQHQDLIDSFLEKDKDSNIKIQLQKENEKENESSSDDYPLESEEPNFLSLTLVKIYIRQKKYDKALESLKKLNLLYPEKNRYFADQIRFLEKLINNTKK